MRCRLDVGKSQDQVSSSSILQTGMLRSTQRLSGEEAGFAPLCRERKGQKSLYLLSFLVSVLFQTWPAYLCLCIWGVKLMDIPWAASSLDSSREPSPHFSHSPKSPAASAQVWSPGPADGNVQDNTSCISPEGGDNQNQMGELIEGYLQVLQGPRPQFY